MPKVCMMPGGKERVMADTPTKRTEKRTETHECDCISRQEVVESFTQLWDCVGEIADRDEWEDVCRTTANGLPSAQQSDKYEYHYDHTDCIWYRPEARNRCPATCAQYRDGWNDAMIYIFRNGKGYRPYRRDEPYGE